jgi:decaprenyl-phosphate phosphoribosyltransferase
MTTLAKVAAHPERAGVRLPVALLRTARPRQWVKNAVVLAAPAAAGRLTDPAVLLPAVAMAAVLVLASAATYLVNDALDVEADRAHPTKSRRPVASGALRPATALWAGLAAGGVSVLLAVPLGAGAAVTVALYLALSLAYSRWLKRVPVVDVLVVTAGFIVRALAGAVAAGLAVSDWFLLVVLFGSLFLVTAKRSAEQRRAGTTGRDVLASYPDGWLTQIMTMALTGTVMAYAAWAFQNAGTDVFEPLIAVSLVPFLAALLRYSLLAAAGAGETPEVALADRFVLGCVAAWAVLAGAGLYLA